MTQEQLSKGINVTRQAVSNWETGKTEPDIDMLHQIAKGLMISIEELIHGENHTKNIWMFLKEKNICSFRSAGVLMKNEKLLVQREKTGTEYALPGGLVEIGEVSEQALIRRFKEEIGADIICDKILWVDESFWEWNGKKAHTITFYYRISLVDADVLHYNREFTPQKCNDNVVFGWIPLKEIQNTTIYPVFIKEKIQNIANHIEHFICNE